MTDDYKRKAKQLAERFEDKRNSDIEELTDKMDKDHSKNM